MANPNPWTMTDILALWGAVVSSFVAGWNIFRDVVQRDRLRVYASIMHTYPEEVDLFTWSITNLGKNKLFVTHLAGIHRRLFRPRWLFARINSKRARKQFAFPFQYLAGSLPKEIAPLDNAAMHYPLNPLGLQRIEELYAVSADGRKWYAPRSVIRQLHANETYKRVVGSNATATSSRTAATGPGSSPARTRS